MISTREIRSTFQNTGIVAPDQVPDLVVGLPLDRIAFGLLYFAEQKIFRFSACEREDIVSIAQPSDCGKVGESGFVAFPFDSGRQSGYFIPNRIFLEELLPMVSGGLPSFGSGPAHQPPGLFATRPDHYREMVVSAVEDIKAGSFQKLVVSRRADFPFPPGRLSQFLSDVIREYPHANTSVFNIPGQGLWVSVTPEILLSATTENGIRSMALAGTRTFEPGFDTISLWSSKELDEHSIVSDFIRESFQSLGISKVREKGPYSFQAGNLIHLRTDFLASEGNDSHFYALLEMLHPTSAVCGSPRKEAMNWLHRHEDFDRAFFSGFSGILDTDVKKLVVNLRVARISDQVITLFAGAGITRASDPEKEWVETGEKLNTLGSLLV